MSGSWPNLAGLSEVNYLPNLGAGVLLLWLATYGFGEEIGWRGFALPRLPRHTLPPRIDQPEANAIMGTARP